MKKIYEKSELTFEFVWIGIYCVLQSVANPLNEVIGIEYSASAVLCILQMIVIVRVMKKNGLMERYGLCRTLIPARQFLYYVPLLLLASRNLWYGAAVNFSMAGMVCYISCMFCVGFVEEVIFRGFLFRALARDNTKTAIIISSITFGLGHLLNLVNGSGMELAENIFQVAGAIAIGFLFVMIFDRGGSLFPCIITHAAINITSAFANETGLTIEKHMISSLVMFAIIAVYSLILTKTLPENLCSNQDI